MNQRHLLIAIALLVLALLAWAALRPVVAPTGSPPAGAEANLSPEEIRGLSPGNAPVAGGDSAADFDPASLDPDAIASLRGAREFGDPRTPPIGRSEPREQATPEELADPQKYAEFEARQERKLKRAYVIEAERYVAQLRDDIARGKAMGIPADEIAKVEEKARRIEAMRAELLAADPALLDGGQPPPP